MYRAVSTAVRKPSRIFTRHGTANPSSRIHLAMVRGRRKDDAAFIVIAGLLALLFIVQLGWVVLSKT
ncbi:MAG TPA: hypothetical protein VEC60_06265 [Reyranella sp.]|nr:hypothetical protein [Reyranella sp.]